MKANEFVKKYGWDLVKRDIACLESGFITKSDFMEHYGFEILDDLKRLVESWELVEKHGGLSEAKEIEQQYWNSGVGSAMIVSMELKQAIADVESCQ